MSLGLLEEKIYFEVELLELYFSDYLYVPRAERVNIYYNLLNNGFNIREIDAKYGSFLLGYYIKLKNGKTVEGNESILVNCNTNVCFFYGEYRIVFLLDISQSLFNYDFNCQLINIEKLEIYLKNTVKQLLGFKKSIRNSKSEETVYSPKLILSFVTMGTDDDCGILSHEIYLDNSNFEEYFETVLKKLKRSIIDFHNSKKGKETISGANVNTYGANLNILQNKSSYLNRMLDQSLYILDLLPRTATPILVIFTDSNLSLANVGNYNNILMQYSRIDINVHIVDLYSSDGKLNLYYFGFINNVQMMEFICRFTGGSYVSETKLREILSMKNIKGESVTYSKNILNFGNKLPTTDESLPTSSIINHSQGHKCTTCQNSISIFLCKKPYQEKSKNSLLWINDNILERLKNCNSEAGVNLNALDSFKILNGMKVYEKETFEKYKIFNPVQRITECRIRESFRMMKTKPNTKNKLKIKFNINLMPDISICYIIKDLSSAKSQNPDKGFSFNDNIDSEKSIRIKIKAPFYIFNHLKLEYKRNRAIIEKNLNNINSNTPSNKFYSNTSIEKVIQFIKEVMCTDKVVSTFCQAFTLDKEFQSNDNSNNDKDNFLSTNKHIWDFISMLSLHTWHRFFNVETLEMMVNNRTVNHKDEMRNFFPVENEMKNEANNEKKKNHYKINKSICEKILFDFCDITKSDQNMGIKLIHKTINNSNKKFQNGFCLVKIIWIYENVSIIYLSFFQTFINRRRKIVQDLINEFHNYQGDFEIICSNRHLVFLLPPMHTESGDNINSIGTTSNQPAPANLDIHAASCFTYRPSKKLIDSYIFKKSFKYLHSNKYVMEKFIFLLIQQRTKENFTFLNSNTKGIILITKISVSKVKNIEEIDKSKIIYKRCLMLYIMQLSPNKDELYIDLLVEPVSGYYMFQFSEREAKIFDERNLNNSLTYYYKTIDKEIFDFVKSFNYLMRETIISKLSNEQDFKSDSLNDLSHCVNNNFTNKTTCMYNSYICFVNQETKKNPKKLIEKVDKFKKSLKELLDDSLDDTPIYKNKTINENCKKCFELVKEVEYKIFDKKVNDKEISYLEKMIVDRFYSFFYDLFDFTMDNRFEDEEKNYFYTKIISKSTLLIIRYPSIDRLLNCCKNQTGVSHFIVIHIKYYFISIERFKPIEKKFSEILSERSSLKTVQLIEGQGLKNENPVCPKMSFWDDTLLKLSEEFTYANNEFFDVSPQVILSNFLKSVNILYKVIYTKNNLMTCLDSSKNNIESSLENLLKDASTYNISFDLTGILCINTEETSIPLEFITDKTYQSLTNYFKHLVKNLYIYEGMTGFTNKTPNEAVEGRIKNMFIMELSMIETEGGESKLTPLVLDEKSFKDFVKNLNSKYSTTLLSNYVALNVKIYFVPEIEDIYSEVSIDQIKDRDRHLSQVNKDNYSIYYYETESSLTCYKIPAFIEYHKLGYFVVINPNQVEYINRIEHSIFSLENVIRLEIIRNSLNKSAIKSINYVDIFNTFSSIDNYYLQIAKLTLKVVSKNDVLKYMGSDKYLIPFYKNTKKMFMFNFENIMEDNDLKKYCQELYTCNSNNTNANLSPNEIMSNQIFNNSSSNNNKFPVWLIFSQYMKKKRLSIDDLKEDEIVLELKWIFIDDFTYSSKLKKEEIKDTLRELIEVYIRGINRKILIKILLEKNICDERLLNKTLDNKIHKGSRDRDRDRNININNCMRKPIEIQLDLQSTVKFVININIEKVYQFLLDEAKKLFSIGNRDDIYKLILNEEFFLFRITISNEKINKKSFTEGSTQVSNLNRFKNNLPEEKYVSNRNNFEISKNSLIIIYLYGLHQPSQQVCKIIKKFVDDQTLLVKHKYYYTILNNLQYVKKLEEYQMICKLANESLDIDNELFNDPIDSICNITFNSWNKLYNNLNEVGKLDIELICNLSDVVKLELIIPQFEPLTEMSINYFENIVQYFRTFKENRILLTDYKIDGKIILIPEIISCSKFAFSVKIENFHDDMFNISYELLRMRNYPENKQENILEIINNHKEPLSSIIYNFLDDLLYVSYLLLINIK